MNDLALLTSDIAVSVVEIDLSGWERDYSDHAYSLEDMPNHVMCINPLCSRGGLDIESLIRKAVSDRSSGFTLTKKCPGDEGSPKGRRPGKSCHHAFRVVCKIKY